jgi:hypothetical protein
LFSDNESASELDDSSSEQEFTKPPKHVVTQSRKKHHIYSSHLPASKNKKKVTSQKDGLSLASNEHSVSQTEDEKATIAKSNKALPPVPRKYKFKKTLQNMSDSEDSTNKKA